MFSAGSCTFDEGFSQCDYQQDPYDDFDWTHINTQEVPYVSPDLPQGEILFFLRCPLVFFTVRPSPSLVKQKYMVSMLEKIISSK